MQGRGKEEVQTRIRRRVRRVDSLSDEDHIRYGSVAVRIGGMVVLEEMGHVSSSWRILLSLGTARPKMYQSNKMYSVAKVLVPYNTRNTGRSSKRLTNTKTFSISISNRYTVSTKGPMKGLIMSAADTNNQYEKKQTADPIDIPSVQIFLGQVVASINCDKIAVTLNMKR